MRFFGLPVVVGFALNEVLKLFGTNLERVMDGEIVVAVIVGVCIFASGIVGAMSAAWSFYKRKLKLFDEDEGLFVELIERSKYGAASLTAEIFDGQGDTLGTVRRNTWGTISIFDPYGELLAEMHDGRTATSQALQAGVIATAISLLALVTAALFAAPFVMSHKARRGKMDIVRVTEGLRSEAMGSSIPMEAFTRRLHVKETVSSVERKLLIGAVLILLLYDF